MGIAAAGELTQDHARYLGFIADGRQGDMTWLAENPEVRLGVDSPGVLVGARSVIVCAVSYHREGEATGPSGAVIARYARGKDYHNFFRKRLRKLATWMRTHVGGTARPIVDTAPVLERAWARRAGVGFVGKNGCVIAPGLGSYILLGEVVTSVVIEPDEPMSERCGTCRLCLDACPTRAFVGPYELDPRRCVSYLTIEHRGEIPEGLRREVGARLFGCDDCQDVCPFNKGRAPDAAGTRDFAVDPRWPSTPLESIATLDHAGFENLTQGTPLVRAGRDGLARNAAVVMGNAGERRYLPVLQRVATHDASPVVREAAAWAIGQIEARERQPVD